jgi:hypothetical protein
MLKKVFGGLAVVLVGFLAFVATRPAHYHVERTVAVSAPAELIYAELDDLRRWAAWSPWDKIDPNVKRSFAGPERGLGASYSWQGNDEVGEGKMTIVRADPPNNVAYKLEFFKPMESLAEATMNVARHGERAHKVTWGMEGQNNFVGKLFCLFVDMDKMLGKDFETGLNKLKGIAEAEANKQRVAAEAPPSGAAQAEAPKAAEAP